MKRGRPREIESPVRLQIKLTEHDYDDLDRIARARHTSIAAVIRGVISEYLNCPMETTSA